MRDKTYKKAFSSPKKKWLKYQRDLYSTFISSILIPVVIIGFIFLIYSNYNIEKRERQDMFNVLESVSQNIEIRFSQLDYIGKAYYIHTNVFKEAEALNNPKLYQYYDDLTRSNLESNYYETITKLIHTSSQSVRSVVFFPMDETSKYAYYSGRDRSSLNKISYPSYHDGEWFQEAISCPGQKIFYGPHIPAYLENKGDSEVYSYVSAIRNMDNKKIIGVVKIDADVIQLQESLNVFGNTGENGLVLSKEGKIFAKSSNMHDEDFEKGSLREEASYQKESIAIADTGLELTYYYSKSTFYKVYAFIGMLSSILIVVGVWMAFIIYRQRGKHLVEDVRQITEVMQCVEKGKLDRRIEVLSKNEIGEIAESINKMMGSLQKYIEKEYLLVIQNQKAEYKALQSQINPHFLYNTLNGFVALNRMGEKKKLEKSIITLSHLFRYSCQPEDITDVQSEISFLEEYLELEKLKFQERLEYTTWVDEECKTKYIPKLLLQPIVENSIIHGMGDTDAPLSIKITAIYEDMNGIGKAMIISVCDNGCGYDTRKFENEKEHVGIENVQARAKLFCSNVRYKVLSECGKGTKTTFIFPDVKQED